LSPGNPRLFPSHKARATQFESALSRVTKLMWAPYVAQSVIAALHDADMPPRRLVGAIGVSGLPPSRLAISWAPRAGFLDARGGTACLNPNIMTF
jgi:hypothetical protein